jgi:hypothetical protein
VETQIQGTSIKQQYQMRCRRASKSAAVMVRACNRTWRRASNVSMGSVLAARLQKAVASKDLLT